MSRTLPKVVLGACLLLLPGTEAHCADPVDISRWESEKDMKRVFKALGDENEMVREAAAQALGRIGDPKAVDPLVIALGDRLGIVRYAAAMA